MSNINIDAMSAEEKRAALQKLLKSRASKYPLAIGQRDIFMHQRLYPQSAAYNMPLSIVLNGPINDISVVKNALEYVVSRHPVLRTRFSFDGNAPSQMVRDNVTFDMPFVDIQEDIPEDWEGYILEDSLRQASTPFDLEKDTLFRFELLKLSEVRHVIQMTVHHIIFDGWSIGVFLRDFAAAYLACADGVKPMLGKLNHSYKDFVKHQQQQIEKQAERASEYWKARLANCSEQLALPFDKPKGERQTFNGSLLVNRIDEHQGQQITEFAKQQHVTLFSFFLSTIYLLLARISRQNDIILGVSRANRDDENFRSFIGMCSENVPMRGQLDLSQSFSEFVKLTHQQMMTDMEHASLPLGRILEAIEFQHDRSHNPLFQAGFDFQNTPWPKSLENYVYLLNGDTGSSKLDLNINLSLFEEGMFAIFEYNSDLFSKQAIENISNAYTAMLTSILSDASQPMSQLNIVSDTQREILTNFGQGALAEPQFDSVLHALNHFAQTQPNSIALSEDARELSYQALLAQVGYWSEQLQANGVSANNIVAIDLPRSMDVVIAMLAIMQAGAAYLPLDPALPLPKKQEFIEQAQCALVLRVAEDNTLDVAQLAFIVNQEAPMVDALNVPVTAALAKEQRAYVIFTSGSTGKAKGVQVSHHNLRHFCQAAQQTYGISTEDTVLQFSSLSFDTSVEEIFPALWSGARLHIRPNDLHQRLHDFWPYCQQHGITVLDLPTAFWQILVEQLSEPENVIDCGRLRLVIVGGEALPSQKLAAWFNAIPAHVQLMNTYGPTETTVAVTADAVSREAHLAETADTEAKTKTGIAALGHPMPNTFIAVVDAQMQPVPPGVWGEIIIAGEQVTQGYLGADVSSQSAFTEYCPTSETPMPAYRTGDIGRFTYDGVLHYQGRADGQVKNRGFRIELSSVEASLLDVTDVTQAAVAMIPESEKSRAQLVAWVCVKSSQESQHEAQIKEALKVKVPAYMIPDRIVTLPQLPQTATGKIDRRTLVQQWQTGEFVAIAGPQADAKLPETPYEHAVIELSKSLLKREEVSLADNFFALGGHSLLLALLVNKLDKQFDTTIPLNRVYEVNSLGEIAKVLETAVTHDEPALQPISKQPRNASQNNVFPASSMQRRLWFIEQLNPARSQYLVPVVFDVSGALQLPLFEQAMQILVQRHEILRTRLFEQAGEPMQEVLATLAVPLHVEDVSNENPQEQSNLAEDYLNSIINQPIALDNAPLFHFAAMRFSPEKVRVFCLFHHAIVDAIATHIIFQELGDIYAQLLQGKQPETKTDALQYADYAVWQQGDEQLAQAKQEREFWLQYLEGAATSLSLPYDRSKGQSNTQLARYYRHQVNFGDKLSPLLSQVNSSSYPVCLFAVNLMLSHFSGQDDIVLASVTAGRDRQELHPIVGFFANTLLLRHRVDYQASFAAQLDAVKQSVMQAHQHQTLAFDEVVQLLGLSAADGEQVFDAMFLYEKEAPVNEAQFSGLQVDFVPSLLTQAKFPLSISCIEQDESWCFDWEYAADLFDHSSIEKMASHLSFIIEQLLTLDITNTTLRHLPHSPWQQKALQQAMQSPEISGPEKHALSRFWYQVAAQPEAPAVHHQGASLNYAQLGKRVQQYATWLQQQQVEAGDRVALCLAREPDLIAIILAVWQCQAVYVPVDPEWPSVRINQVLSLSQSRLFVCAPNMASEAYSVPVQVLDDALESQISAITDTAELPLPGSLEQLSHLIFTSGSTGTPKAVSVMHQGINSLINWAQNTYSAEQLSCVLAATPVTFDISVFELIVPVCSGGSVYLIDNILQLAEQALPVSLINTVPSVANALLEQQLIPASVNTLNLAGEALTGTLLSHLTQEYPALKVYNLYGPSEDTTYSTWHECQVNDSHNVPIGKPLDGTKALVVNSAGVILPEGAMGELYLSGEGLAAGYYQDQDRTDAAFVSYDIESDNVAASQTLRVYKTGDRVAYGKDGELRFYGRQDHQVKLHGRRIELDEITQVLLQQEAVKQALVMCENGHIVAFISPQQENVQALRDALSQQLPGYMVPTHLLSYDTLPVNAHGKTDRKRLSEDYVQQHNQQQAVPLSPQQQTIATLWQQVLGDAQLVLAPQSSFYQVGGHSLLLLRLRFALMNEFGVDVSLLQLMQNLTLETQANLLASLTSTTSTEVEEVEW
ncbi:non-ribosomal peptide synthetase [Alteromonas sp. a30]|uniref:non-ribosomal peptide synthetase n=1 Tax=Alteromonas sp. a30 TaxID=2730917 RepID=UPI0022801E34|nr:non-ribosomal peptide synthetase [Alteromonas sp. a30]MCY7294924.1 amino acid adenylation domain-containing protein [Alteromonas sp. a30]